MHAECWDRRRLHLGIPSPGKRVPSACLTLAWLPVNQHLPRLGRRCRGALADSDPCPVEPRAQLCRGSRGGAAHGTTLLPGPPISSCFKQQSCKLQGRCDAGSHASRATGPVNTQLPQTHHPNPPALTAATTWLVLPGCSQASGCERGKCVGEPGAGHTVRAAAQQMRHLATKLLQQLFRSRQLLHVSIQVPKPTRPSAEMCRLRIKASRP